MQQPFNNLTDKIKYLLSTDDKITRNSLALDLAETGDPRVMEALIELIQRPELKNCRGTLVHALEDFDYSCHASLLIDLVRSGNWEVTAEACFLLDNIDGLTSEAYYSLIAKLQEIIAHTTDQWRRDFAEKLLNSFML